MMYTITELYIYPVKSLGGIALSQVNLSDRGLEYDRRWMLIDLQNRFLTQREHPELALFSTAIAGGELSISHLSNNKNSLKLSLNPTSNELIKVQIWDDICDAIHVSDTADQWFSERLNSPVRLIYMPDESQRIVDRNYTKDEELTSFSDGYPILLIGQCSLDDLNKKLETKISMERFRPNIVFSGGKPYEEDEFKHFSINGIEMFGVKLCARCVMTTIDQKTGESGKEPLATLSSYRREGNKVNFGQNVIFHGQGTISIGDTIERME